jgi:hypothetical protein
MKSFEEITLKQRVSQAFKNKDDKKWYKNQADLLDTKTISNSTSTGFGDVSEYKRKKINYDLFNNIINLRDFEYVCKPYGSQTGELPANFTNRDIISSKIKVLLGMEMKMPFSWKVMAVNEEATTRKEQEEFKRIKEYVQNQIMLPIKQQMILQEQEKLQGKELSPQEQQELMARVEEQSQSQTPEEVRKYMMRDHQDPAEAMAHQILEYVIKKQNVKDKFNKAWKHATISGQEVYWIGILNGEPQLRVVNPLYFNCDKSPDIDYVEDGEWATCEYRMTPSEIIKNFGAELTNSEIDEIYNYHKNNSGTILDADFSFNTSSKDEQFTIRVLHTCWKSLKKIGFLTYTKQGIEEPVMKLVDENYKLNLDAGDIKLEWEWIPEVHETWKIGQDLYCYMRPVPGQHKDLDTIYESKLPYYGAYYDNLNSETTSLVDRMKAYQYFYNIIMYRIELKLAGDKGKKFAMNINSIPKTAGMDLEKTLYFLESAGILFLNPNEEGNRGGADITNMVKEIDMSLVSDIQKYIQLAEYIERRCGDSVGITKQMEGGIGPTEAVTNTRQALTQSSHIIQPYFELHNIVKGNVLTGLLEMSKVAYSNGRQRKLNYILDDLSYQMLTVEKDLLDSSTYGMFVSNSSKSYEIKELVQQLSHAALQNQRADLSDVIKVYRSESIQEAEELMEVSEQRKTQEAQQAEQNRIASQEKMQVAQQQENDKQHARELEKIRVKAEEERKTRIQEQTILSLGFNEDKDTDKDGTPDIMEVAKFGVDAEIKRAKIDLDRDKLEQKTKNDEEKIKLEKKKLISKNTSS